MDRKEEQHRVAIIHQSGLSTWNRCPHAYMLAKQGQRQRQSSAMAYGSVMHYALETFERLRFTTGVKFADAVEAATQTFTHYWHPANIEAICPPVDMWYPRQTYNDMRIKGIEAIKAYSGLMRYDDHELLATEFSFQVPIFGTWDYELEAEHVLAGTIDRLAVRHYAGVETVCVDDYKTGAEYRFLRQNLQFTAYCYATTRMDFWIGYGGEDGFGVERGSALYQRFLKAPRRGTWINMRTVKFQDAGWRGPDDYTRFALAVEQQQASEKADIFPLSISGEHCQYCEFKDICAGVGVPDNSHGAPK
jgi:ATP-dependent helicase/DNAse subunit B